MSARLLPALVAAALLVTGCSGGGDDTTTSGGSASGTSAPAGSGPKDTAFADLPGEAFVTTEPGLDAGIQVKAVDAAWTPELAGVSAEAGKHYLAVYVAVTGELADQGVQAAKIKYLQLRSDNKDQANCDPYSPDSVPQYCFTEAYPASDLKRDVANKTWRDEQWQPDSLLGTDLDKGETAIGVVGFAIEDSVTMDGLQLCGPTKDDEVDTAKFACAPIPKPDGSRS